MQSLHAPDLVPSIPLTRRRKAAMIVQMLFRDGEGIPLTRMPQKLQAALAHEMGAIRLVGKDTVAAVAEEFVEQLDSVGLVADGDTIKALDALGDKIDPGLAERLRAEILAARNGDPWPLIAALPEDDLINLLNTQSIQIGGVVLSKLTVTKAATVLGRIPGERARRITFGMSQTANISPDAVLRIGKGLVADHCQKPTIAFQHGPDARLGAILNTSPAKTRDDVLESLTTQDPEFADDVRKRILTFADLPARLKPTDIPVCLRNIENDQLNMAIAAALSGNEGDVQGAEFILSNMSQRMATQLREAAQDLGNINRKAGEEAMNAVTTVVREMATDGLITYLEPDEPEV